MQNNYSDEPPTDGEVDGNDEVSSGGQGYDDNLNATRVSQQISYFQDINLLNEARENLETILDMGIQDSCPFVTRMLSGCCKSRHYAHFL